MSVGITPGAAIGLGIIALVAMRSPAYTGPKPNLNIGGGAAPAVVVTSVAPAAPPTTLDAILAGG